MFKIFSPSINQFSDGGIMPSFSKTGKWWNTFGTLKSHLIQRCSYTSNGKPPITALYYKEDDVVVEYKMVEVNRTPVKEWLKEHEERKTY